MRRPLGCEVMVKKRRWCFDSISKPSFRRRRMVVLNGSTGNAAVQVLAADNSPCSAVVAPNVLLQYAMGPVADPNGQYCGLDFAGGTIDFGYYAIPFNRRVPRHIVEAIDTIILAVIDTGNATTAFESDFPVRRPKCDELAAELAAEVAAASKEPPPLGLTELAGACTWGRG